MGRPQYTLYLSHSWLPEHVDLNVALWDHIWEDTLLMVDDNQEEAPPFYVSRIEHLIRGADILMAVLVRPVDSSVHAGQGKAVSPYVQFEIALARRAGLPYFVLYDTGLEVQPPGAPTAQVRYLRFDSRHPSGLAGDVAAAISVWLKAVTSAQPPRPRQPSERAALLLPATPDLKAIIAAASRALKAAGYLDVTELTAETSDIDALDVLRSTDLLVVDLGDPSVWDTYGMAHALAVPAIRSVRGLAPIDQGRLPRILRGGLVGYHNDVVNWSTPDELADAVGERARAIRQAMTEIDDLEEGRQYFERRR